MHNVSLKSKNTVLGYLLFLIWPAFAMLFSILNYRSSYAKNVIWLSVAFFGFSFVIARDGADSGAYKNILLSFHEMEIGFFELIHQIYLGEIARGDYVQSIITYWVSRFTDDYRILFMCFGLFMGYFYSRNIWYLIQKVNGRIKPLAVPLLLFFALIVPFWQMNGFRFWTATHMFVFGALPFLLDKKKGYLLVALATPLLHIGFLFPAIALLAYAIIGTRKYIWIPIFIASVFLLNLDLSTLIGFIPQSDNIAAERLGGYANEQYAQKISYLTQGSAWYVEWKREAINYVSILVIAGILLCYRRRIKEYGLERLFYFCVLMFSITSIIEVIPSMGRFFSIAHLSLFALLFLFVQRHPPSGWVKVVLVLMTAPILLYIGMELRFVLDFCGPGFFLTNPLIVGFFEFKSTFMSILGR